MDASALCSAASIYGVTRVIHVCEMLSIYDRGFAIVIFPIVRAIL